jgi:hypothetical protein
MSTKFGYNMTSNKLVMTKVHVFFEWPSYMYIPKNGLGEQWTSLIWQQLFSTFNIVNCQKSLVQHGKNRINIMFKFAYDRRCTFLVYIHLQRLNIKSNRYQFWCTRCAFRQIMSLQWCSIWNISHLKYSLGRL